MDIVSRNRYGSGPNEAYGDVAMVGAASLGRPHDDTAYLRGLLDASALAEPQRKVFYAMVDQLDSIGRTERHVNNLHQQFAEEREKIYRILEQWARRLDTLHPAEEE